MKIFLENNFSIRNSIIISLILLVLLPLYLFSSINSIRNFTTNDGLINDDIQDVGQDDVGNLWVITKSGISIFDGSHWQNYPYLLKFEGNFLNDIKGEIRKFLFDESGVKFFLSNEGLIYRLKNNQIEELVPPIYQKGGKLIDIKFVLEENRKILWASTQKNGLVYYDNSFFTFTDNEGLLSNQIISINSFGSFLFVVMDKGIQVLKDRKVIYTFSTDIFKNTSIVSLGIESGRKIRDKIPALLIFSDNRLYKLENEKLTNVTYEYFSPYRERYSSIFTNGNSKLYLVGDDFIKIINHYTNEITIISKDFGLKGKPKVLYIDDEKNLWIGTDRGLTRITFTNIIHWTEENGLGDKEILSSEKIDNDIYFGHENGLITLFSKGRFFVYNLNYELNQFKKDLQKRFNHITKIISNEGLLLLLVGDWGIFRFTPSRKLVPVYIVNGSEQIFDFAINSKNEIYMAGNFYSENEKWKIKLIPSGDTLEDLTIPKDVDIKGLYFARDGSLWLRTSSGELFHKTKNIFEKIDLYNQPTKIYTIKEDRGSNLFVGTDNGFVIIYKSGEKKFFDINSALTDKQIFSMYFDELNNLWFLSSKGLSYWDWKEFRTSLEWRRIPPHSSNINAILEYEKYLIISSRSGVFRITPDESEIKDINPRVYLVSISIDGEEVDLFSMIKRKLEKELYVKYNAVLLSANNNIEFTYILEGLDKTWSTPTTSREIRFINLPPGEYRFGVKARTSFTEWSLPVYSSTIIISKPFYRNWGTIIILILIISLLGVLILIFKSRKGESKTIQSLKQQLESIDKQNKMFRSEINKALEVSKSRMSFLASLSHELRTPINSIIGFVEILLEQKLKLSEEERMKYLNYININSRRLLILINDILDIAKIDSGNISFDYSEVNLNAEVREVVNLFREKIHSKQLDLILELDSDLEKSTVYIDKNRLHQIILNLITNSIKFTFDGFIKITTKKENNRVYLIVEDTGIGIPNEDIPFVFEEFRRSSKAVKKGIEGTGLGLSITKRLVEMMGGNIKIESEEEVGTKVTVSFERKNISNKKFERDIKANLN